MTVLGRLAAYRLGAVLAFAVGFAVLGCGDSDSAELRTVERLDLVITVEALGELEARDSAKVGPPALHQVWNYTIARLPEEGSHADAGEPVLWFDTTELQQRLMQAIAKRDSAQKQLEKRKTDLDAEREREVLALAEAEGRLRRFSLQADVPADVVASSELELARLDLKLAEAEVDYRQDRIESVEERVSSELRSLQAKLARAQSEVDDLEMKIAAHTVKAPRAGEILFKTDWRGEKKKVGERIWQMDWVIQMPDLNSLFVVAEVDESQAGRIAIGQPVRLNLDAHSETSYSARVSAIQQSVRSRSWRDPRRVVGVELELEEIDLERMRPGMRVKAQIEVERVADALVVPLDTLANDATGAFVVGRTSLGTVEKRPEFGRRNDRWVEVVEGLEEGDVLLVPR